MRESRLLTPSGGGGVFTQPRTHFFALACTLAAMAPFYYRSTRCRSIVYQRLHIASSCKLQRTFFSLRFFLAVAISRHNLPSPVLFLCRKLLGPPAWRHISDIIQLFLTYRLHASNCASIFAPAKGLFHSKHAPLTRGRHPT